MGYFYISLAVLCFAGQFAFTNVFQSKTRQNVLTVNTLNLISGIVGALICLIVNGFVINFSVYSLIYALLFAFVMIFYNLISVLILSIGNVAIYSMFMMMGGMMVPFFYGVVFLQEPVSIAKAIGFILLTAFLILQVVGKNDESKNKFKFYFLCVVVFFVNGATAVLGKAHQIGSMPVDEISFTALYSTATIIFALLIFAWFLIKGDNKPILQTFKEVSSVKALYSSILMSFAMVIGNALLLYAANSVDASVQYPMVSGGTIVISTLLSVFVFKDKLRKIELFCILGIFISTFLFLF